jgi:uncharacterized membrane protein
LKIPRFQLFILTFFIIGVFFRFTNLGNKIYSHDEAYTSLRAAGYTGSEVINAIWDGQVKTRDDIQLFLKPSGIKDVIDTVSVVARSEPQLSPLYFIFSHYWMRWVGYSPASMRGLAALLSLFAIPGMYWLSLELFKSRRIALVSAAIISLSPFSILFAQDARPYSLWASLALLSSAAFLAAIRKNKNFVWGIYSLSIIIGVYSHLMFALVVIAHGLYLVAVKESRLEGRIFRYMVALFFTLLAFTPWLYQIFIRWNNMMARIGWSNNEIPWLQYIQRWILIFTSPLMDLYFSPRNIIPYILRLPVLLLMGYSLYFLVVNTPKRVWAFLLLLIGVSTLPFLLSDLFRGGILSTQGRYYVLYSIAVIPVIAFLIIEKLSVPRANTHIKWYLITALLIAAQLGSAFNILWAETWWTKKLTLHDPQMGHMLNEASNPLLIVDGLSPTDLGDILALSFEVDEDVKFRLYQNPTVVELPLDSTNIYWFHQTYKNLINSEIERQYKATEVVP